MQQMVAPTKKGAIEANTAAFKERMTHIPPVPDGMKQNSCVVFMSNGCNPALELSASPMDSVVVLRGMGDTTLGKTPTRTKIQGFTACTR